MLHMLNVISAKQILNVMLQKISLLKAYETSLIFKHCRFSLGPRVYHREYRR